MLRASGWFDAAAEVVGRLTNRWVRAGALAANEHRLSPRPTTDADILLSWHEDLVATLEGAGYGPLRVHQATGTDDHPYLLMSRGVQGEVDFIVAEVDYQELAITRGLTEHCLTPEDVIVHKLLAWRPRDRDDVASVLLAQAHLDIAYIEKWAEFWEVTENWEEANRPPREQRPY